ncbi:hypothetical protein A4D02_25740 [Niastella koreensis]|nr:hypothetical protein A4D02_25740 [Niastella koreensis]
MLLAGSLLPLALVAQHISLDRLLSLQRSSLITIQDYLETSTWKLKRITSLSEADSNVFQSHTRYFLDSLSLARKQESGSLNTSGSYYMARLLEGTKLDAPAWVEYLSQVETRLSPTTLFTNSFTITMPKYFLFNAINLRLAEYTRRTFHHALRFSFGDGDTFKSIITEIGILNLPDSVCYIMYNKPLITRVYKLADQVINLVTIDTPTPTYSLEIYARADYEYLHGNEQELKGKVDYIQ